MFNKLMKDLDNQTDAKFEHNRWEFTMYSYLDNNLIDSVYSSLYLDQGDEMILADEELIHHLRKLTKELEFLVDL